MRSVTTPGQREQVDGYEPFFGLHEAPFSLAPDPRFLFASASHSAALAQVAYALERREPLVVITGEIGTGKTLLCRTVLQQLRRKTFLSVIDDPLLERDDLLKQLLQDFGIIAKDRTRLTEASRHELVQTLQVFLRSLAPIQAHAVVIIDEAQHLRPDVLEQIRLLSNVDDDHGTLLQIILVGQTDLEPLLARPELRQLQQRVSRRLRLEPLNRGEVEQYIKHRLARARGQRPTPLPGGTELAEELAAWEGTNASVEFTSDAIHAVSRLSGGLPRVINLLCDRSLEEAHASRLRIIDDPLVHAAARALSVGEQAAPPMVSPTTHTTQAEPGDTFWPTAPSEPEAPDEAVLSGDAPVPVSVSARTRPAAAPSFTASLVLAASLAFAAVATWFAVRPARPEAQPPPSVTAAASSPTLVFSARPDSAQAAANTPVPDAATTTGTPTPPTASAPATALEVSEPPTERREVTQLHDPRFKPSTPAPPAAVGRFEIVVASFRTDARATSVTSEVSGLGLPVRRRVSNGWHQVLCGPFASRPDAEDAQQRLHRAGLSGTHVVPTDH
jgi:general secretion pathway protein A